MAVLKDVVMAAVGDRTPVDERERMCIEQFLVEIERLTDPFSEHADPVHVTTSALIVGQRGVVLHRHRILGIWVAPGGHIDLGENPWDAVMREAAEETGLTVGHVDGRPNLVHVDVHPGPHGHTHLDLRYRLHAEDTDPCPPADESQEVAWFSWAEALAITEPCMAGILTFLSALS